MSSTLVRELAVEDGAEYHAMFRMDEGLGDLGGKAPEAESFLFHFFLRHAQRSNALTDFDA